MAENDRFPVKLFPSATATDVLFYTVNGPKLDKRKIPAYGTPYNDITPRVEDWPNHKLVHVGPSDGEGMQKWFFAADRENQDAYNFERKRVEIGGTEYDAVTRTYLIPRASFTPAAPAIGSDMPNVPQGLFVGPYKLYDKDQGKVDMQELDSLYIIERRTYVNFTGGQEKTRGQESLKPAKYKRLVTEKTTRTLHPLEGETIPSGDLIPTPPALSGDQKSIVFAKRNDEQFFKVVTEETLTGASALAGEEYGDIVTKSVSENVVVEGTAADTGIDVISSVVDPFGDGDALKQTKRVKGGAWPNPVDQAVSKENGNNPPARYTRDITRTTTTRKIAPGSIPSTPTLSGNEVGKSYKKETPDRAEEEVVIQTFTLNTSSVDEALDQKPFVIVRSRMTPGTSPVLPTSGNGSSRLVYEAPDGSKVYENTAEVATARTGPAGQEKDVKPFGTFTTAKSYSLTNSVSTPTGSSNVIYNDGAVLVYELGEITFSPTYRDIGTEVDKEIGFTRTTRSRYSGTNLVSGIGSASISYTDGVTVVYEIKETTLESSGASFDGGRQSSRLYTKMVTTTYGTSSVGTGENYESDVVITDGATTVYRVNSTTITAKAPLVYDSVVRDQIPSRLVSIDLIPVARRDDRTQISVFVNIEEGYTGAFPARVTEYYTEDPQAVSGFLPITMKPTAISYQGILFNLSIGETLHSAFTLTENIGTSDPDYMPQTLTRVIPATEPAIIPAGYQPFAVSLEPFESGFLVKKIEIKYR